MTHTEVICQPGEKDASQPALAQISGETSSRQAIVFRKGGIRVNGLAKALTQNQFRVVELQVGVKCRAQAALHAMIGPEHLVAVVRLLGLKRISSLMIRGEGVMIRWMPVLGQDH